MLRRTELASIMDTLKGKKNLVLQGPTVTGKTFDNEAGFGYLGTMPCVVWKVQNLLLDKFSMGFCFQPWVQMWGHLEGVLLHPSRLEIWMAPL